MMNKQSAAKATEHKPTNQTEVAERKNAPETSLVHNPQRAIMAMQNAAGNRAVGHLLRQGALQTKLKVNTPGDHCEQEADRIAEQVLATPTQHRVSNAPPRIQRFSGQPNEPMDTAPASVDQALANPGQPLEPALRRDMEQRFGHDFSHVRVHSGAAAEQSAQDMNANAYTVGHDIVFGAGRFAPGTNRGERLIAHELTHVIQADVAASNPALPANSVKALEHEARRVAAKVDSDSVIPPVRGSARGLVAPLRDGPDDPGKPTFGNLPGDAPGHTNLRRVELVRDRTGKWSEFNPNRTATRRTAAGSYDFVVQNGRIYAVRSSSHLGHTDAALGGRVTWAGQISFSKSGMLKTWDNASGHYLPSGGFAGNAHPDLPMDLFVQTHRGSVVRPDTFKRQGPQLPVFQPKKSETSTPSTQTTESPSTKHPPTVDPRKLASLERGGQIGEPPAPIKPPARSVAGEITVPNKPESTPTAPPTTTAISPASTPAPAAKTKTNEPTARLGMPDAGPLHVGGPSARGTAVGGGVVLGAQLKDWIMGMLGDKTQAERVNAALQSKLSYIQSMQQDKPELGAYITIYWRVYRGNEGETVHTFEDISVKFGTTEQEARESREGSLLNLSASPDNLTIDTQWIPPVQPLSLAEQPTPYAKIAIATFALGRARLQGAEWGGVLGFDKLGRRSETLTVPQGAEPRFAILTPPRSISFWNGKLRHNTDISIVQQMTSDGFLIPVVADLDAALVFPLNEEAVTLLAKGRGIKDNLKQLQGNFGMTRWVPTEAIQIVRVLDSSAVAKPPPTEEKKMQLRITSLPINARTLLQRMSKGSGAKLSLTPKALERFEQIVPFDLSDEDLDRLTRRLKPVGDRSIDSVLNDLEKSIAALPGRSPLSEPRQGEGSASDEGEIRVSASEKPLAGEYKPTNLGFKVVKGVKSGQYEGNVIKVDRAALVKGTLVTLADVEVVVKKRVFIPNEAKPEKVVMTLEVTKDQHFDIEQKYGTEFVHKIGYKRLEYKKGVKFSHTLQLK